MEDDDFLGLRFVTWAQMESLEEPGKVEGFYCIADYGENSEPDSDDVATFTGTAIKEMNLNNAPDDPDEWCDETDQSCTRMRDGGVWTPYFASATKFKGSEYS